MEFPARFLLRFAELKGCGCCQVEAACVTANAHDFVQQLPDGCGVLISIFEAMTMTMIMIETDDRGEKDLGERIGRAVRRKTIRQ